MKLSVINEKRKLIETHRNTFCHHAATCHGGSGGYPGQTSGRGGGGFEHLKVLINTFHKFPEFESACNINILEKSKLLKSLQKKNINNKKVIWLKNLDELDKNPSIFIANEFFDALPIKQFIKKKK